LVIDESFRSRLARRRSRRGYRRRASTTLLSRALFVDLFLLTIFRGDELTQ
jgi:hypothetical protein